MAMMDPGNWSAPEQPLPAAAEDDFQQFLEMGGMSNLGDGLQFDFQDFNGANGGQIIHGHGNPREDMDTRMSGTDAPPAVVQRNNLNVQNQMPPITSGPGIPAVTSQIMPPHRTVNDAISEIDAQIQFLQHQRIQQQHRQLEEQQRVFEEQQAAFFAQQQRNMVPPTPQSLEMQAANQYFQHGGAQGSGDQPGQHSQGMFDRYQRLKEQQDMAFTPLVSPAVTPLDAHFPVETQYTVPGAYFSPLTSPALHAQTEALPGFEQRHAGSTTTNSPVEMDLESSAPPPAGSDLKKVRKSNVSKARKPNVRQSPISKPQRRKTASTPTMNAQILSELAENSAENGLPDGMTKPTPSSVASTEDSENASVSPEALTEMPPPPVPQVRSARPSPYLQPQSQGPLPGGPSHMPTTMNGKPSPATPATLFRISPKSKSADATHPGQLASEHIENFELPESASFPKTQPPRISTQQSPLVAPSPSLETVKGSPLLPLPSPATARPPTRMGSASESPLIGPKTSSTPNPRKTPLMAPRATKKRSSSSVHVSPALRPKISPSIKPLLPGTPGMSAEDSASRLLASKSNYQNILEGNTVPGVSYPSELSTNLTSKRTSHKIAEQGRRNRINSALQEIATLLPKHVTKDVKEDEADSPDNEKCDKKDGKNAGNAPNSKASTVEMAIVYIKQLKQELADANKRAEEAERRLAAA